MPKKMPQVAVYLKQLSRPELVKLASRKKIRIPSKWQKGQIVEFLIENTSASEVNAFLCKAHPTKTKEAQGYASALKGKSLEDKTVQIFTRSGFQCDKNIRLAGMEIDVFGTKKGGFLSSDEHIIAECKNKSKVTPEDFKKFVGNMNLFIKRKGLDKEHVQGYLITTGVFDKDVKAQARVFPRIQLKRVKV